MNAYKFITHTLNMKPHIHATHSHEILFTTHTYLTFTFSLINPDSRNAAVNPLLGLSYTRLPLLPRPHRKSLGTKLAEVLVSQARPFPFRSADRFQYAADTTCTKSDRCCGTERVWLTRVQRRAEQHILPTCTY